MIDFAKIGPRLFASIFSRLPRHPDEFRREVQGEWVRPRAGHDLQAVDEEREQVRAIIAARTEEP